MKCEVVKLKAVQPNASPFQNFGEVMSKSSNNCTIDVDKLYKVTCNFEII